MRPLLRVAAVLAVAGFVGQAAPAEICIDFTEFCDGLEITIAGDVITGFWRNTGCDGIDIPISGIIRDGLPLPCKPGPTFEGYYDQNPAKAGIACIWDWGCENDITGADWYFLLDGLDGTLDSGVDYDGDDGPPGRCSIDEVPYEILLGPCPFAPQVDGSAPGVSLSQAIRERLDQP